MQVLEGVVQQMVQQEACKAVWFGYLSSTGVYGDWQGGWVDEECVPFQAP
jgi:hypothetical protein